jgi:hypothetical protein
MTISDPYCVPFLERSLLRHPEVDPCSSAPHESILDLIVVETNTEHLARQAWLGCFEFGCANAETIADVDGVFQKTLNREVLAESAVRELEFRQLSTPEVVVLDCVGIDGLIDTTVDFEVGLAVTLETEATDTNGTRDRLLEDPGTVGLPSPGDFSRQADVYGYDSH